MVPVDFEQQILPGTFEYSLHYLVDNELDLSLFDSRFKNDESGRPAYDPAILLKIVLLAYSRGVTSSRKIETLCRENVIFMAISADSRPLFTTIADFISGSSEQIADLFGQVLMTCDALGLIGKEMFAVDGCKMPSNASKEWRGTKADLKKKAKKIDEHGLLEPMIEQIRESFNGEHVKDGDDILKEAKFLADSGYHNEKTLDYLEENEIDGYVADNGFRSAIRASPPPPGTRPRSRPGRSERKLSLQPKTLRRTRKNKPATVLPERPCGSSAPAPG